MKSAELCLYTARAWRQGLPCHSTGMGSGWPLGSRAQSDPRHGQQQSWGKCMSDSFSNQPWHMKWGLHQLQHMWCLTWYKVCQDKTPLSFFLLVSKGSSRFALAQDVALWPHELHCQYVSCSSTYHLENPESVCHDPLKGCPTSARWQRCL